MTNFPFGGSPIWPPLFDLIVAAPARLLYGPEATAGQVERAAAWVPPVLAALTVGLAALFGREVWGAAAGVVLALFVALAPGHVNWSQYGHVDQHVLESLTAMLLLWLFVRSRRRASVGAEVAAGAALALAVLSWQGAVYWAGILAVVLLIASLRGENVLRPALTTLGLASVLVFAATRFFLHGASASMTYILFGDFQPAFLAAAAFGTILLDTAIGAWTRRPMAQDRWVRGAALLVGAGTLSPVAARLAPGIFRGIAYLTGRTTDAADPAAPLAYPRGWLSGIFENRPLFQDGTAFALRALSAAFFLVPVVVVVWAVRARRDRSGPWTTLAAWGAVTFALAALQRRNVYYAVPLAAAAAIEAARVVREKLRNRGAVSAAAAAVVALLLAAPMVPGLRDELRSVQVPGSDLFATLTWMHDRLPRAVDAYDPGLLRVPPTAPGLTTASSVLAPWSLGHMLLYEAEQPVVANNFGYGFLDSIRFFLADTEEEALRMARARRARWVLATDLVPRINDYAGYLERPAYLKIGPDGALLPTPRYFATLQSRLYDFDGAGVRLGDVAIAPLGHFRLLHHSQSAIRRGNRWIARWKVFEIIE